MSYKPVLFWVLENDTYDYHTDYWSSSVLWFLYIRDKFGIMLQTGRQEGRQEQKGTGTEAEKKKGLVFCVFPPFIFSTDICTQ